MMAIHESLSDEEEGNTMRTPSDTSYYDDEDEFEEENPWR